MVDGDGLVLAPGSDDAQPHLRPADQGTRDPARGVHRYDTLHPVPQPPATSHQPPATGHRPPEGPSARRNSSSRAAAGGRRTLPGGAQTPARIQPVPSGEAGLATRCVLAVPQPPAGGTPEPGYGQITDRMVFFEWLPELRSRRIR